MLLLKLVFVASFLLVVDRQHVSAHPRPGVHKKRLIIYTPVKYKIIHHHKLEKVPIFIKKHVHYNVHPLEEESKPDHHGHYHYIIGNSGYSDDSDDYNDDQHDDHHTNHHNGHYYDHYDVQHYGHHNAPYDDHYDGQHYGHHNAPHDDHKNVKDIHIFQSQQNFQKKPLESHHTHHSYDDNKTQGGLGNFESFSDFYDYNTPEDQKNFGGFDNVHNQNGFDEGYHSEYNFLEKRQKVGHGNEFNFGEFGVYDGVYNSQRGKGNDGYETAYNPWDYGKISFKGNDFKAFKNFHDNYSDHLNEESQEIDDEYEDHDYK